MFVVCMSQYEWFFSSWDEDVYVPVDEEADEAAPISSVNLEMLAKAESLGMCTYLHSSDTRLMHIGLTGSSDLLTIFRYAITSVPGTSNKLSE